mmetsp:Transcript_74642/g.207482  ORF Transcript_74642/g.207482 Transcript_74642/m.207482 type:complete len:359 (-) Transcript_74642:450-1526(-)
MLMHLLGHRQVLIILLRPLLLLLRRRPLLLQLQRLPRLKHLPLLQHLPLWLLMRRRAQLLRMLMHRCIRSRVLVFLSNACESIPGRWARSAVHCSLLRLTGRFPQLPLQRSVVLFHKLDRHAPAFVDEAGSPFTDEGLLLRHLHRVQPVVPLVLIVERHPLFLRYMMQGDCLRDGPRVVEGVRLRHRHVIGERLPQRTVNHDEVALCRSCGVLPFDPDLMPIDFVHAETLPEHLVLAGHLGMAVQEMFHLLVDDVGRSLLAEEFLRVGPVFASWRRRRPPPRYTLRRNGDGLCVGNSSLERAAAILMRLVGMPWRHCWKVVQLRRHERVHERRRIGVPARGEEGVHARKRQERGRPGY